MSEGLRDICEFVRVGDPAMSLGVWPARFEQYSLFGDGLTVVIRSARVQEEKASSSEVCARSVLNYVFGFPRALVDPGEH